MISSNNKRVLSGYLATGSNYFLLLLPGGLSSLLIFLLSSNRLLPNRSDLTLLILNLFQLQMLGITIVKYGIDQAILSRLRPGNFIKTSHLYKQRVIPLLILFCGVIGYLKGWRYSLYFLAILPMEVLSLIITVELNISAKYKRGAFLTFLGYPLAFLSIFLVGFLGLLSLNTIFIILFSSSLLRLLYALTHRNKAGKEDIAIMSYHIPLQQIGNFFMFRFDQLLIAWGVCATLFIKNFSASQYLFLAKFPEMSGGIIVGLAPILYKRFADDESFSLSSLLKDKFFIFISLAIIIFQLAINFLFLQPQNIGASLLLYLPFILGTLLFLPTNLITYRFIKEVQIGKINWLNLLSILTGIILFSISLICHNPYILSLIVPCQLLTYILCFHIHLFPNKIGRVSGSKF